MSHSTRNIVIFTSITLGGSLLLWGSLILLGFQVPNLESQEATQPLPMIIYIINGFIPSITGLILYLKEGKKSRLASLIPRKNNIKDSLLILGIFMLIFLSQTLLYNWLVGDYNYGVIGAQLGQLIPLIILGPLSEELGWRGYLQDQFDSKKPLRTSLWIGLIWALWHLPLFFILGTTQQTNHMNFLTFVVLVTLVSYIMTYFYQRNMGSLFVSVLIHYLYTVILTFFILGTSYSLLSDIVSIIPVALVVFVLIVYQYRPKTH